MPTPMPKTGIRRSAISRISTAIERLAPRIERTNRRMQHETVASRIQVLAAYHHEALQRVQNAGSDRPSLSSGGTITGIPPARVNAVVIA